MSWQDVFCSRQLAQNNKLQQLDARCRTSSVSCKSRKPNISRRYVYVATVRSEKHVLYRTQRLNASRAVAALAWITVNVSDFSGSCSNRRRHRRIAAVCHGAGLQRCRRVTRGRAGFLSFPVWATSVAITAVRRTSQQTMYLYSISIYCGLLTSPQRNS